MNTLNDHYLEKIEIVQKIISDNDKYHFENNKLALELYDNFQEEGLIYWLNNIFRSARYVTNYVLTKGNLNGLPQCPWEKIIELYSIEQKLDCIFSESFKTEFSDLYSFLLAQCKSIIPILWQDQWRILYIVFNPNAEEIDAKVIVFVANTPAKISTDEMMDKKIPLPLQLFYHSHNGFGYFHNDFETASAPGVLPFEYTEFLSAIFDEFPRDSTRKPDDYLLFCNDGLGGGYCFDITKTNSILQYDRSSDFSLREITLAEFLMKLPKNNF